MLVIMDICLLNSFVHLGHHGNMCLYCCNLIMYLFNYLYRLGLFHALFQEGREICAISRPPIPRTIFKNSRDREGGKSLLFHALPRKYGKRVHIGGREMWAISRPPSLEIFLRILGTGRAGNLCYFTPSLKNKKIKLFQIV